MERIKLSKEAKTVINLLVQGSYSCQKHILQSDFNIGALELQRHQLAYCHEEENGNVEVVRLSDSGKIYIKENPSLRNPVDWKWIITTTIVSIAALAAIIALFIACTRL